MIASEGGVRPAGNYSLGLALMAAIPVICTLMRYFFNPKRAARGSGPAGS